ncbi:MAG: GNAT family N-acetyltransferase [Hyphomicrobiaceae bacterium]
MTVLVRRAVAGDQEAIHSLARGERVNPTGLSWPNFVVATNDAAIMGAVQLRVHRDGSKELATLVVAREWRKRGFAAKLIETILTDQPDRIFMITGRSHAHHYARWGFLPIAPASAPLGVRRNYRLGYYGGCLFALLQRRAINHLVILDRISTQPCCDNRLAAQLLGRIPQNEAAA